MKRLHWMILRMLPGPFLGWLGTLMFLFLMQFLMKYLPDIVGKGLPLGVILELICYNLAYMVVLAVPMSALLATLMAFGQLAASNAYLAIKSTGISLPRLIWPVALAGLLLTGGMMYFNNEVLPEANFRAKNLWRDIRTKKPGFELEPGIFYNGLSDYSILVDQTPPESNQLIDVTVYDYTEGSRRQSVIKAERGRIRSRAGGAVVDLVLRNGEVHRLTPSAQQKNQKRYERLAFDRFRLRLDLSDFVFERSAPRSRYRSDRTTPTVKMVEFVDSLQASIAEQKRRLRATSPPRDTLRSTSASSATMPVSDSTAGSSKQPSLTPEQVYAHALRKARSVRASIDDAERSITWEAQRADRYRVEIHKKISIAVACLIFVLVGAPLGLSVRGGSLGKMGALAVGIFLFYWITLVQGEKFADRGMLSPWVGMWIANLILAGVSCWLLVHVSLDLRATPPLRRRLWEWLKSKFA